MSESTKTVENEAKAEESKVVKALPKLSNVCGTFTTEYDTTNGWHILARETALEENGNISAWVIADDKIECSITLYREYNQRGPTVKVENESGSLLIRRDAFEAVLKVLQYARIDFSGPTNERELGIKRD